jgi:serine phosphatase RsbU (regulator of sigma subunit)
MNGDVMRVLLIEDDEEDYIIVRHHLNASRERRFALTWANTLADGLAKLSAPVDAIITDLSLPDSQGWDTFVKIREHAFNVPIILLTGLDDESLAVRAVHEGAQDYLVKGHIDAPLLCRAILYAIERKRIADRLEKVATDLRVCNVQLDADVRMAREVHQALMPHEYPAFPPDAHPGRSALRFAHVCRPCRAVGGDFLHIRPVADLTAGVFVCDVMGHGMRSALVTAIVRGLLEELRGTAHDAGRLLKEMNSGLVSVLRQPGQLIFASALYLVINARTGTVRGANAGHPLPMRVASAGGPVSALDFPPAAIGPALGIAPDPSYVTLQWQMDVGDRLLLYTDGVCDVTDLQDAEYGVARLCEAAGRLSSLPLGDWLHAIVRDAEAFSGRTEFDDDICMIGVERAAVADDRAEHPV